MMKKQILFLMIAILLVTSVIALDSKPIGIKPQPLPSQNFGLSQDKVNKLADKGISNVEIIEYPCQDGMRCFAVAGDINQSLISINTTVRDNCIQNKITVPQIKTITYNKTEVRTKTITPPNKQTITKTNVSMTTQKPIQTITNYTVVVPTTKSIVYNTTRSYCSGIYNYREMTQDEVDSITNNALNHLLDSYIPQEPNPYYPIPDNTNVQSKSISIGNSVGSWVGKLIKQIGGIIGI